MMSTEVKIEIIDHICSKMKNLKKFLRREPVRSNDGQDYLDSLMRYVEELPNLEEFRLALLDNDFTV